MVDMPHLLFPLDSDIPVGLIMDIQGLASVFPPLVASALTSVIILSVHVFISPKLLKARKASATRPGKPTRNVLEGAVMVASEAVDMACLEAVEVY